jgi:hypothetical protein
VVCISDAATLLSQREEALAQEQRDRAREEAAAAEDRSGNGDDGVALGQHPRGGARENAGVHDKMGRGSEEKRGGEGGRDAEVEEEERERAERDAMMEDGRVSLAFADDLGMAEVIKVMHAYKHHAGAQEQGSIALRRLAISTSQHLKTDKHAHKVIKTAVETLLEAMAAHLTHPGVQGQACATLSEFVRERSAGVTAARFGGVRLVLLAMAAHEEDEAVQARACAALASMASNTHSNKLKIAEAGGAERVVAAMRTHAANWDVQAHGCTALCVLALSSHELLLRVRDVGGYAAIERIASPNADAHCDAAVTRAARLLRDKLQAVMANAPAGCSAVLGAPY